MIKPKCPQKLPCGPQQLENRKKQQKRIDANLKVIRSLEKDTAKK